MNYLELSIKESNSKLSFKTRDSSSGKPWCCYLDFEDEPLYYIGNLCDTCYSLFGKTGNATLPLAPEEVSKQLRAGVTELSQPLIETIATILPTGNYIVKLIEFQPKFVRGHRIVEEDSKEKVAFYNWPVAIQEGQEKEFSEAVLPIIAEELLQRPVIEEYKARFKGGENPTALTLSMIDIRYPSMRYINRELVHFLLDGHHKMMAASELGMPIRILSFLTKTASFADKRFFEEIVKLRYK